MKCVRSQIASSPIHRCLSVFNSASTYFDLLAYRVHPKKSAPAAHSLVVIFVIVIKETFYKFCRYMINNKF